MGKVYDLTYEDITSFIQEVIKNNIDLNNWSQENTDVAAVLESIFYIRDTDIIGKEFVSDKDGYYGVGSKASLYRIDSKQHICVKSMVLDFIKIFFSPEVWHTIKAIYCKFKNIADENFKVEDIYIIITNLKKAIVNNIVKLTDENFCLYLQMVTHFKEHAPVSIEEMIEWLPDFEAGCCWDATDWECRYCVSSKCTLKGKENYAELVKQQLEKMTADKLLLSVLNKDGIYKINY